MSNKPVYTKEGGVKWGPWPFPDFQKPNDNRHQDANATSNGDAKVKASKTKKPTERNRKEPRK